MHFDAKLITPSTDQEISQVSELMTDTGRAVG